MGSNRSIISSSSGSISTSALVEAAMVEMLAHSGISGVGNDSESLSQESGEPSLEDQSAWYNESLLQFIYGYRQVHGGLSLGVCVFGIIANVLNIIVLSRKNMISPTNAILTGMAVSDLVVIAIYIPHVVHHFLRQSIPVADKYTYGWAVYTLAYAFVSVVFHSISIWLTVLLAVWRYVTVKSPTGNKSSSSMSRALIAIIGTYALVPVFCMPVYFCFTIQTFSPTEEPNATLYKVDMQEHQVLQKINFWMFSVCLKLVPCISLTYLTVELVRILYQAKNRRERLLGVGKFGVAAAAAAADQQGATKQLSSGSSSAAAAAQQQQQQQQQLIPSAAENHKGESGVDGADKTGTTSGGGVYLELADSSPTTEYDQSSKSSSRGGESVGESGGSCSLAGALLGCCNKFVFSLCSNLLDRCFWCCGFILCCPCFAFASSSSDAVTNSSSASANGGSGHGRGQFRYHNPNQQTNCGTGTGSSNSKHQHRPPTAATATSSSSAAGQNSERTTRMLIAVLIMFLVCEFPMGILALLSGILGKLFFVNIYNNCGEIMDMLALINSAVNFVLYCLMSAQFRKTFWQLFCIRWTERVSATGGGGAGGSGGRGFRRGFVRPEATFATELMGTYNETPRKSDASGSDEHHHQQQQQMDGDDNGGSGGSNGSHSNSRNGSGSGSSGKSVSFFGLRGGHNVAQETIEMSTATAENVPQSSNAADGDGSKNCKHKYRVDVEKNGKAEKIEEEAEGLLAKREMTL